VAKYLVRHGELLKRGLSRVQWQPLSPTLQYTNLVAQRKVLRLRGHPGQKAHAQSEKQPEAEFS